MLPDRVGDPIGVQIEVAEHHVGSIEDVGLERVEEGLIGGMKDSTKANMDGFFENV